MNEASTVFIAGHTGLVGSALVRAFRAAGHRNLITRTRQELDLRDQRAVDGFFSQAGPEYVVLAAARVGGILANATHPADFLGENLMIQTNVIHAAWRHGVKKLLFLGSSCIYPKLAPQPLREDYLLTGPLEPTNEWYAIAKLAGIRMCQAYRRQYGFDAISALPTNLYGPGDNFDLQDSHVLPALLRKISNAVDSGSDRVVVWGTGTPRREFLHVDDLAQACLFLLQHYDDEAPINVGSGEEISIAELAALIAESGGYRGRFEFDTTKPDGTPRKLLEVSRLAALGWRAEIPLRQGVAELWDWYRERNRSQSI